MKKLVVSAISALVLGTGFGFASNAAEAKHVKTPEKVKVVKLKKKEELDLYLIWSWVCSSIEEYDKVIVRFEDLEIKIQCKIKK
jgi:S-adenosylmethionine synthetase